VCVCVCVCCAQSCLTLCYPVNCSRSASFVHGFSRQGNWSGVPPTPGNLPNPGFKLRSPGLQADSLLSKPPGKSLSSVQFSCSVVSDSLRPHESQHTTHTHTHTHNLKAFYSNRYAINHFLLIFIYLVSFLLIFIYLVSIFHYYKQPCNKHCVYYFCTYKIIALK